VVLLAKPKIKYAFSMIQKYVCVCVCVRGGGRIPNTNGSQKVSREAQGMLKDVNRIYFFHVYKKKKAGT